MNTTGITTKETIIHEIITAMSTVLEAAALRMLDNVLRSKLHGLSLEEECTDLTTWRDDNEYILKVFEANKKLEGCTVKTLEQYRISARQLFEFCNKNFRNITKDDVKIFLAMRTQRVAHNTVVNNLRNLSSFFSWLHEEGYIIKNPTRGIKIRKGSAKKVHLSIEEEVALKDVALSLRDRALVDFLLSTGVRVGEAAKMDRENIDFRTGAVTFMSEKSRKERTVYMDARARLHLLQYLNSRTDSNPALFVTTRSYEWADGEPARISNHGIEVVTKVAGAQAGIKKICTVHVLRRTFATRLDERGCALEVIQELLGHQSAETTKEYYVANNPKKLKNEIERCMAA